MHQKENKYLNNLIPNTLVFFVKEIKMKRPADLRDFFLFLNTSFHVIIIILITLLFCTTSPLHQVTDVFNQPTFCTASHERQLRNRSALAVNCCVIIHCLEVSCKEDQITSAQRE